MTTYLVLNGSAYLVLNRIVCLVLNISVYDFEVECSRISALEILPTSEEHVYPCALQMAW
jgi:hypothetical protein